METIKFLAIGDPHFKTSTIGDNNILIQQVLRILKEQSPDFCVVLGDLLHDHEKIHSLALNQAHSFIRQISEIVDVYVCVGNHDMINHAQFLTENHWMNGMKCWERVTIADKPVVKMIKGHQIIFTPYVPNGRFIEALDTSDAEWKESSVIFAHQEFKGCKMGAFLSETGDEWDINYPLVISGHIHDRQYPQKNIIYTGSSIQHAFGESHSKSISMFNVSDEWNETEICLNLPKRITKYLTTEELDGKLVKSLCKEEVKDYIRLSVTGSTEEFNMFKKGETYKKLIKKGIKIVFKPKVDKEKLKETRTVSFTQLLKELIDKEAQPELTEAYNKIFVTDDQDYLEL